MSTYKTRLLEKTGTHSLVELLQIASQRGLLRRKAGVESENTAALFNSLLSKVPFPVCLRAPDARILAANQAYLNDVGYQRARQVRIKARSLENVPGQLQWMLEIEASVAPDAFRAAPVIHLALATQLCVLLQGNLRVMRDDQKRFHALIQLQLPMSSCTTTP